MDPKANRVRPSRVILFLYKRDDLQPIRKYKLISGIAHKLALRLIKVIEEYELQF